MLLSTDIGRIVTVIIPTKTRTKIDVEVSFNLSQGTPISSSSSRLTTSDTSLSVKQATTRFTIVAVRANTTKRTMSLSWCIVNWMLHHIWIGPINTVVWWDVILLLPKVTSWLFVGWLGLGSLSSINIPIAGNQRKGNHEQNHGQYQRWTHIGNNLVLKKLGQSIWKYVEV